MERLRLFVAVVLRGELAARVDGLRSALGSAEIDRIAPHITLVPPVNVAPGDLGAVLGSLRAVGETTAPFPVSLGPVRIFARDAPVLYLAVADPKGALDPLATACRAGPLAPTAREGRYPFVPHVTVLNRATRPVADAAILAMGSFSAPLEIASLSLLGHEEPDGSHRWREIADFSFESALVRGRGGIEIVLTRSALADPEAAALAGGGDGVSTPRSAGDPWAVTARSAPGVVGVARGATNGDAMVIDELVVAPAWMHQGVGTRMVEVVESTAEAHGVRFVVARTDGSPGRSEYFESRGYRSFRRVDGELVKQMSSRWSSPGRPGT